MKVGPQAKDLLRLPGAVPGEEGTSPGAFAGGTALPTPRFQTPSFQARKRTFLWLQATRLEVFCNRFTFLGSPICSMPPPYHSARVVAAEGRPLGKLGRPALQAGGLDRWGAWPGNILTWTNRLGFISISQPRTLS